MYDPEGAINYIASMFINGLILVNSDCGVPVAQFSGWEFEDGKAKAGFPYCECLSIISTELKKDLVQQQKKERVDYGE